MDAVLSMGSQNLSRQRWVGGVEKQLVRISSYYGDWALLHLGR